MSVERHQHPIVGVERSTCQLKTMVHGFLADVNMSCYSRHMKKSLGGVKSANEKNSRSQCKGHTA